MNTLRDKLNVKLEGCPGKSGESNIQVMTDFDKEKY
jgi:hypothetical protein